MNDPCFYLATSNKVGITAILEAQLEAANTTIRELLMRQEELTRTIQEQSATIKSLESTIKNLEELLLKKAADLFAPPLKALAGAVKGSAYNLCDETYHKILVKADDNEGRGSRKEYLWDMIAPGLGLAYFFYDEGSRSEDVILNELENYEGIIQSDGPKATADTCRDLLPDRWKRSNGARILQNRLMW